MFLSQFLSVIIHDQNAKVPVITLPILMVVLNEVSFVVFVFQILLINLQLSEVGGIPEGILDIWEATGSRPSAKYTWDMRRNNNLRFTGNKIRPQHRFDRLYMRPADSGVEMKPVYFEFVGVGGWVNQAYSRLSTTHGHITDWSL